MTGCTYSGFTDEPEGGPVCGAKFAQAIECVSCNAIVVRCLDHGGVQGARVAMARHREMMHAPAPLRDIMHEDGGAR